MRSVLTMLLRGGRLGVGRAMTGHGFTLRSGHRTLHGGGAASIACNSIAKAKLPAMTPITLPGLLAQRRGGAACVRASPLRSAVRRKTTESAEQGARLLSTAQP